MAFGIDDAIGLGIGAISTGMGIFGASAQNAAQRQAYKDAVKFQKANDAFAKWQAQFNKTATDAQNKFNYWGQIVQHSQNKAYINSLRNIEKVKAFKQAELVFKTRASATASFILDSEAISNAYQEQSMQEAVALQQYQWRALQTRGSVQAMESEGLSVDRIVNDYARQMGDYESLQQINAKIRTRQYSREQAGQVAQYLSRWNSQTFYDQQPYMDPVRPYAPLPAIMMPPPPSMTGAGPSRAAGALNIGTAVLGGLQTGIGIWQGMRGLNTPSSASGSGVPLAFSGIDLMGGG